MNVLLVGSGGREHAIAWKLSQSKKLRKLYIAPGNPGTAQFGENVAISDTDIPALVAFAKSKKIDLAVIGPEDPLSAGIVDEMEKAGIMAFGPSGAAAQIEADKAFSKQIMRSNSIPPPKAGPSTSSKMPRLYRHPRRTRRGQGRRPGQRQRRFCL
jgi:phosphoribosylamine--glycine ligase